MEITPDGYFLELWSKNRNGEIVYPYLKTKRGELGKGFDVSPTGKKPDYRLMSPEEFLDLLAKGAFKTQGHIRMQPRNANAAGKSGGFLIPKATMSDRLSEHLRTRVSAGI